MVMIVESTRFGAFEVDETRSIEFPEGIMGFPGSTRYVIVEVEESPYSWLQSLDEPEVAFLSVEPWDFFPDYDLELGVEHQNELGISSPDETAVLVLLTVHRDGDAHDAIELTANLLGPVVINSERRLARQVVLDKTPYTTREPLVA